MEQNHWVVSSKSNELSKVKSSGCVRVCVLTLLKVFQVAILEELRPKYAEFSSHTVLISCLGLQIQLQFRDFPIEHRDLFLCCIE